MASRFRFHAFPILVFRPHLRAVHDVLPATVLVAQLNYISLATHRSCLTDTAPAAQRHDEYRADGTEQDYPGRPDFFCFCFFHYISPRTWRANAIACPRSGSSRPKTTYIIAGSTKTR